MEDDGLVAWLLSVVKSVGKARSYDTYLGIFCIILTLPNLVSRCMSEQGGLGLIVSSLCKICL